MVSPDQTTATYDESVQGLTDNMHYSFCFMLNARSTVSFPFGNRKALVSVDSNCSRHMTGFYRLVNARPCHIVVDGAFDNNNPGVGKLSGDMVLGDLCFSNTVFVEGIRETIISLGQLDEEGCTTQMSKGKMSVFGPAGDFLFSAFLHNGRYFLDTNFYYGQGVATPTTVNGATMFAISDAKIDNSAELWHCRMGHANMPDIRRLQHLALGVNIHPKHKLDFCEPCILAKLKNAPFQNLGEKPSRPKQVFGADVTGPHPTSPAGFKYLLEVICFFSGMDIPSPSEQRQLLQNNFKP